MASHCYSVFLDFNQSHPYPAGEVNHAIASFLAAYVAATGLGFIRQDYEDAGVWHDIYAFGRPWTPGEGQDVYSFTIRYQLTQARTVRYGQLVDGNRGGNWLMSRNDDFIDRLLAEGLPAGMVRRAIWLGDETTDDFDYIFAADLSREPIRKSYGW
jgi:hypothetical protein